MRLLARADHVTGTYGTRFLAALSIKAIFTRLVTSGTPEAKFTDTSASSWVASVVVIEVAVTYVLTIHAKPSTGALILTLVAFVTRRTVAFTRHATTVRSITTNTFTRTVYTKLTQGAGHIAALTFEPGSAGTLSRHVIARSTVLARAFSSAVAPVESLRTDTITKDTRITVYAIAASIHFVAR